MPNNLTDLAARMRLEAFRRNPKNSTARGFATVRLRNGLVIADIAVCSSHGRTWASLPSKPILDADGRHATDANGKKRYVPILQWADREVADRWSAAVVELVRQEHPGVLDNGGSHA